jgi:TRAP-type uncharacterized transport system fused permease subunit
MMTRTIAQVHLDHYKEKIKGLTVEELKYLKSEVEKNPKKYVFFMLDVVKMLLTEKNNA